MRYVGDFALGQTVRFAFSTSAANGGRVGFSDALEAGDIRVYKNLGTTERASTAGYTVTSTFDTLTGIHAVALDTSDNTDAGFWVAGADYSVILYPDTETVDSQSVAAVLAEFSIENRFPSLETFPTLSVGAHPLLGIADSGVPQSVASGVVRLRAATEFNNANTNNGAVLGIRGSGGGGWQYRAITAFNSTTKDATIDALAFVPTGNLYYTVLASAPVSASQKFPATLAVGDIATDAISAAAASAAFVSKVQSGLATASALATVDGRLDTEIPAILAAVDTEVAAIKAKTDNLPASPAAVGSAMTLDSGTVTTLVNAIVRAANGADGYAIVKDVPNNQIVLTIPGVGTVNIPADFNAAAIGVDGVG